MGGKKRDRCGSRLSMGGRPNQSKGKGERRGGGTGGFFLVALAMFGAPELRRVCHLCDTPEGGGIGEKKREGRGGRSGFRCF